ncbi:hypothetical protein J4217_01850 [Candidatus Pacearchaeota archaeon]|nr:hypothetical protein [Candidatus Pacearchaeota archaeon]
MAKSEKQEAIAKILKFFSRKRFSQEELKKTRKLAMKNKLKLSRLRQFYCQSCFSQLKGQTRIGKKERLLYKTVICRKCKHPNKFKI